VDSIWREWDDLVIDNTSNDFDASMFDSIADIDLFRHVDPAFDLDGFDACLESNLNQLFQTPFNVITKPRSPCFTETAGARLRSAVSRTCSAVK